MTAVRPAPASSPIASSNGFGTPPPPPRRPRNIAGVLLGVLLVLFCATAVAVYTSNAGHRRPVLVMVRTVRAGAAITPADLGDAQVAADSSVHAMPASERSRVVGRTASVDLLSGTLLTTAELGSGPAVAAGRSVVGLNVKLGYAPAGLRPGVRVRLVFTPSGTGAAADSAQVGSPGGGGGSVLVSEATVYDVTATPDGQGQIVSVIVDDASAPVLAAAGARGEVSVILLGGAG